MTDEQFDSLEDQLRDIDPENEYFTLIGIGIKSKIKIRHQIPMLSCDKVKDAEGVFTWLKKIGMKDREAVVEPKIDGLSCSIIYKKW